MIESLSDIITGDFSTKKKNQKEIIRKALSHKERKVRVAQMDTVDNSESEQNTEESPKRTSQQRTDARINARHNAEIDDYLLRLLMDNMIDEAYWKFHTKAVYVLGLAQYNQLVIESRDGRKPKNLLAFKIKGAIELHYKKKVYRERYNIEP